MSNNTDRINKAYTDRAIAARIMCKLAERLGYDYGYQLTDDVTKDPEWRKVVYIEFPEGQISWHISPNDWHMFEGIKEFSGAWDGSYNSQDPRFAKLFQFVMEE